MYLVLSYASPSLRVGVEILVLAVHVDLSFSLIGLTRELTLLENPGNTEDVLLVAELELCLVSFYILHHLLFSTRFDESRPET